MSCCFSTENRSGTTNTAFSPNCLAATASPIPVLPAVGSTTVPPSPHVAAFEHAFEHVLPDAVLDARTGVERLSTSRTPAPRPGSRVPERAASPRSSPTPTTGAPDGSSCCRNRCRLLCVFPWLRRLPLSPFAVIIARTLDASFPNSSSGAGDRTNLCPSSGSEEV